MKKVFFVLCILASLNVVAQSERAFFTRDSSDMDAISKMVLEPAKNKYQLEKAYAQRSVVEFRYTNQADKHEMLRVIFKVLPENQGWMMTHATGPVDDLFPYWKKHFDPAAEGPVKQSAREAKKITTPFLNGNSMFYFSLINDRLGEIKGGYIPSRN